MLWRLPSLVFALRHLVAFALLMQVAWWWHALDDPPIKAAVLESFEGTHHQRRTILRFFDTCYASTHPRAPGADKEWGRAIVHVEALAACLNRHDARKRFAVDPSGTKLIPVPGTEGPFP